MTRVHDRFVVAAPIGGTLERIELDAGAVVAQGAALARIRPPAPALLDPRSRDEATARVAAALARHLQADTAVTRTAAANDEAIREADRGRRRAARSRARSASASSSPSSSRAPISRAPISRARPRTPSSWPPAPRSVRAARPACATPRW